MSPGARVLLALRMFLGAVTTSAPPPSILPSSSGATSSAATASLNPASLGTIAVQLALHFSAWVHRRRFTIEYVDDTTIRQRMSVDFVLPPPQWFWTTQKPVPGSTVYVPLHIIKKVSLTSFNIRDEDNRPLSLLTVPAAFALTVDGLTTQLVALSQSPQLVGAPPTTQKLRDAVSEIVTLDAADKSDPLKVTDSILEGPLLAPVLHVDAGAKSLLRDMAKGMLMLVPIVYEPGRHRLLKAEWDGPNYWHGLSNRDLAASAGATAPRPRLRELQRHLLNALAFLGWADKRQSIPDLPIGWARSTHVEIVAPEEVEMTAAALMLEQYDPDQGQPVSKQFPPHGSEPCTRPRVNLATRPLATGDPESSQFVACRGDTATLNVSFRSSSTGVFPVALVVSAITSILLWSVTMRMAHLDVQTSAAVLLVLPAIVAAYLARPGEHPFPTRLLAGVRLSALGVGLCSLAATAVIGLGTLTHPIPPATGIATIIDDVAQLACQVAPVAGCDTVAPPPAVQEPDTTTQFWLGTIAFLASVMTGILAIGFLRRWVLAWWRYLR